MYNYATALALGNGVDENRADALDWFQRAAALGHAKSINLIGGFYEDGWSYRSTATPRSTTIAAPPWPATSAASSTARLLAERGRIDEALAWLARVPATATPAFVAKMHAYLASSPIDAFRVAALELQTPPQPQPHCMESAS